MVLHTASIRRSIYTYSTAQSRQYTRTFLIPLSPSCRLSWWASREPASRRRSWMRHFGNRERISMELDSDGVNSVLLRQALWSVGSLSGYGTLGVQFFHGVMRLRRQKLHHGNLRISGSSIQIVKSLVVVVVVVVAVVVVVVLVTSSSNNSRRRRRSSSSSSCCCCCCSCCSRCSCCCCCRRSSSSSSSSSSSRRRRRSSSRRRRRSIITG